MKEAQMSPTMVPFVAAISVAVLTTQIHAQTKSQARDRAIELAQHADDLYRNIKWNSSQLLSRDMAIHELIAADLKLGRFDEARKLVDDTVPELKLSHFCDIASAQANAGDLAAAKRTIESAEASRKAAEFSHLPEAEFAEALIHVGFLDRAQLIANGLPDDDTKVDLLVTLACGFVKNGDTPAALRQIQLARDILRRRPFKRVIWARLLTGYLYAGDITGARSLIDDLTKGADKASVLVRISSWHLEHSDPTAAKAQIEETLRILDACPPDVRKIDALAQLATVMVHAGLNPIDVWTQAHRDVLGLPAADAADAHSLLAVALRETGDTNGSVEQSLEALAAVEKIEKPEDRYLALWIAALFSARAQNPDIASRALKNLLENPDQNNPVASHVAYVMAALGPGTDLSWIENIPDVGDKLAAYANASQGMLDSAKFK